MLSPKKLLENARNRIVKRENWTQGTLALDSKKQSVLPTDPDAVCWCALGALSAEAGNIEDPYGDNVPWERLPENYREAVRQLVKVSSRTNYGGRAGAVFAYNDANRHEDVLGLFDKAIANTKGE